MSEYVEGEYSVAHAVLEDLIGALGPFSIHLAGIDVELVLVLVFWPQ